jgi:hypothetical protein
MQEKMNPVAAMSAAMSAGRGHGEAAEAHGTYVFRCFDREGGSLLWEETLDNVVCTQGKNTLFNAGLAGSSYTVTGPYLGLISSASFSAVSVSDTMTSHAGWLESGNANAPTYTGPRPTAAFAAASGGSIALVTAATFNMTGSGTVQGAFLTFGTGAVGTIDNTGGSLYSAGTFSVAQPVVNGNVLTCSYSTSM